MWVKDDLGGVELVPCTDRKGLNGRQVRLLVGSRDLKASIAFSLAAREQPVLLESQLLKLLDQGTRTHSSEATPAGLETNSTSRVSLHATRRWQEECGPRVRHDPLARTSAQRRIDFEFFSVAFRSRFRCV